MRCPRCGNEVSPNEAFCGQCGTPVSIPAQSTETVNTSVPRNALPGAYNTINLNYPNIPPTAQGRGTYPSQMPPSSMYNNTIMPAPPSGQLAPNQQQPQPPRPSGPLQQTGFYQDATEAITSLPPDRGQGYPPGYQRPQQGFTGMQGQSGYSGGSQYNAQVPYQTTNFPSTNYPASSTPIGQGYGYGTQIQPSQPTPPPKKQTSAVLVFAIVALIVAIITVSAFGAIFLLHNNGSQTAAIPTVAPTVAVTPTTAPSPTPSPVPTVTPTPVPSPTVAPTPTPDANFAWCTTCTTNGFLVEYPQGWNQTTDGAPTNIRFVNPAVSDQYAEFKTPGVAQSNASQLIANDLLATYAPQQGYTPPTGKSTATIGGENWIYETAYYQLNGQQEQVQVYATVHQQNAYIIELEATTSQFPTVNSQTFMVMLGRFLFQQPTS